LTERLKDMLGCATALVGTAAAFRRRTVSDLDDFDEDGPSDEGSGQVDASLLAGAT
jgi:hypothetical protein